MKKLAILTALTALAGCGGQTQGPQTSFSLATSVRSTPWNTAFGNGVALETAHYRIYSTANRQDLLRSLPPFMEACFQQYSELTDLAAPAIGKPLPVYMLGSRSQWAQLTRSTVRENVDLYLKIQAGGYCYRGVCVFWDIGGVGTYSLAAHEGLHQFLGAVVRQRLPSWLEEGLATVAEGCDVTRDAVVFTPHRNVTRFTHLRDAIVNGHWIGTERLLSMDAGDAIAKPEEAPAGYYGQLWALVLYIRSNPAYRAGLARLVADAQADRMHQAIGATPQELAQWLAGGREYNRKISRPLFEHYITRDLAAFDKGYLAFARKLAKLE